MGIVNQYGVEFRGNQENILERISQIDGIVSDFDGTDVKTPLKKAAMSYISSPKTLLEKPELIPWGFKAVFKKLIQGKDAESVLWKELSGILEEDTEKMIENLYDKQSCCDQDKLKKFILPGVLELYNTFEEAEKFYISRNYEKIISLYSEITGVPDENIFTGANKWMLLEKIILDNPQNKRYLVRGDSKSDDEVLAVADFYKEKGNIDDYVGVAIGDSSHSDYRLVDVVVTDDQRGLVELINDYKISSND